MSFKIYTKTGDKGSTALIGGSRVPKSHIRIEAYGTIDELNSWIGLINDLCDDELKSTKLLLFKIQNQLFDIGSHLACDPNKKIKMPIPELHDDEVTQLELAIDDMDKVLPPLKNFILPGGNIIASHCHIARCVCRRAERIAVGMTLSDEPVEPIIIQYLNRLSDYLFALSRFIVFQKKGNEILWQPRGK
ncbi:MAG TPA: cob(I)yrinic acid a,c-diamide adenosyltransferase [Chitinophagaceae bacterium]|nr:MAG: ATP/cobalamin adenosyltransferase [Bacteroidetes bacterium OLB11]HMN33193.1 cob(I)yrinic acid a,c-diamide adenosyltransferase [Chitinophagaceae bacterium]